MKSFVPAVALVLLISAGACASPLPTLSLIPSSGTVAGFAGAVVGWGYDVTNPDPSDWVVLTDTFVDGSLASGTYGNYVDYIGATTGIVIDPSSTTGDVAFSQGVAGAGEFDIDRFAPAVKITGDINIDYAVFSQDPNSPSFDPSSFLSAGTLTAAAEVDVTPEPASVLLMSAALLPLVFGARRRARRHP